MHTRTHKHIHTHTRAHADTHARSRARTHKHTHARTHAQTHTCAHAHTHARAQARSRTCTHGGCTDTHSRLTCLRIARSIAPPLVSCWRRYGNGALCDSLTAVGFALAFARLIHYQSARFCRCLLHARGMECVCCSARCVDVRIEAHACALRRPCSAAGRGVHAAGGESNLGADVGDEPSPGADADACCVPWAALRKEVQNDAVWRAKSVVNDLRLLQAEFTRARAFARTPVHTDAHK